MGGAASHWAKVAPVGSLLTVSSRHAGEPAFGGGGEAERGGCRGKAVAQILSRWHPGLTMISAGGVSTSPKHSCLAWSSCSLILSRGSETTRHVGLPLTIPVQSCGILASKASIGKHSETFSQASSNMLPGSFSQVPSVFKQAKGFCFVLFCCFLHLPLWAQKSTAHTLL